MEAVLNFFFPGDWLRWPLEFIDRTDLREKTNSKQKKKLEQHTLYSLQISQTSAWRIFLNVGFDFVVTVLNYFGSQNSYDWLGERGQAKSCLEVCWSAWTRGKGRAEGKSQGQEEGDGAGKEEGHTGCLQEGEGGQEEKGTRGNRVT